MAIVYAKCDCINMGMNKDFWTGFGFWGGTFVVAMLIVVMGTNLFFGRPETPVGNIDRNYLMHRSGYKFVLPFETTTRNFAGDLFFDTHLTYAQMHQHIVNAGYDATLFGETIRITVRHDGGIASFMINENIIPSWRWDGTIGGEDVRVGHRLSTPN